MLHDKLFQSGMPRETAPVRRVSQIDESNFLIHETLIADLCELIAAIDRRVPCLDRQAEPVIAREAAGLRREAVDRLAELGCS